MIRYHSPAETHVGFNATTRSATHVGKPRSDHNLINKHRRPVYEHVLLRLENQSSKEPYSAVSLLNHRVPGYPRPHLITNPVNTN